MVCKSCELFENVLEPVDTAMQAAYDILTTAVLPLAIVLGLIWFACMLLTAAGGRTGLIQFAIRVVPLLVVFAILNLASGFFWNGLLKPAIAFAIGSASALTPSAVDGAQFENPFTPILAAIEGQYGYLLAFVGQLMTAKPATQIMPPFAMMVAGIIMLLPFLAIGAFAILRLVDGMLRFYVVSLLFPLLISALFFQASRPLVMNMVRLLITAVLTITLTIAWLSLTFFQIETLREELLDPTTGQIPISQLRQFAWSQDYVGIIITGCMSLGLIIAVEQLVASLSQFSLGNAAQGVATYGRGLAVSAANTVRGNKRSTSSATRTQGANSSADTSDQARGSSPGLTDAAAKQAAANTTMPDARRAPTRAVEQQQEARRDTPQVRRTYE